MVYAAGQKQNSWAVLLDPSKVCDCIPHDLLIAKFDAYGFEQEALINLFIP